MQEFHAVRRQVMRLRGEAGRAMRPGEFLAPEKRMAGHHVRPNFDKTPIGSMLSPSAEPRAIMRQL